MYEAVDGCGRGHRVFEDAVPRGKRQVAGDHHTAALVALCQQAKQDFHLLPLRSEGQCEFSRPGVSIITAFIANGYRESINSDELFDGAMPTERARTVFVEKQQRTLSFLRSIRVSGAANVYTQRVIKSGSMLSSKRPCRMR
jgi:hypothetical protein